MADNSSNGTVPKPLQKLITNRRRKKKKNDTKQPEKNISKSPPKSAPTEEVINFKENNEKKDDKVTPRQPSPLPTPSMSEEDSLLLQKNFIKILTKKSTRNPSALFQCDLCHYHCDTLTVVHKHVRGNRHLECLEDKYEEITLQQIPQLHPQHLDYLSNYVLDIQRKFGMNNDDIKIREDIASTLDGLIKEVYPDCAILLYGSSTSKLGLKDSNVNLDLFVQSDHVSVMKHIGNIIAFQFLIYKDVKKNFTADMPSIEFIHLESNLRCILCINTENALDISRLLGLYEKKDSRFRILAVAFRVWGNICQLSDTNLGTWNPYAFYLMTIYFLQQLNDPVLPIISPSILEHANKNLPLPSDLKGDVNWKSNNTMCIGELWINLFKFYAVTLKHEHIVCIQQLEPLSVTSKKWSFQKGIPIEDPFHPRLNVSRTLHPSVVSYVKSCFRITYKYFAIPHTGQGSIYSQISDVSKNPVEIQNIVENHEYFTKNYILNHELSKLIVTQPEAQILHKCFNYKYLNYFLQRKYFVKETLPEVCTTCFEEGHNRIKCPEELEPLSDLKELTPEFCIYLNNLCEIITNQCEQNSNEIKEREEIVKEIEDYIIQFWSKAKLELFGSSCNGFGIRSSDIDMCLILDDKDEIDLEGNSLIKHLGIKLKNFTNISDIIPIVTAKVPILKMKHVRTNRECDLSISNRFGQRNTYLLKIYSEIDPRARTLGYIMKKLGKCCDIADASRGSLSSYAYILMVIYFLQQVDPPVLPVLQELYANENDRKEKSNSIDGYNTYFYDDLSNLAKIWPLYKQNKTSVGELWVQFLRFYTEEFDFKNTVISIRQHAVLTRFEKLWTSRSMAIEDPFNLSHNLGARLSWKMNVFILKVFRNARLHFGTPVQRINIPLEEYFFDLARLVTSSYPNERFGLMGKQSSHILKESAQKRNTVMKNRQTSNPNPSRRSNIHIKDYPEHSHHQQHHIHPHLNQQQHQQQHPHMPMYSMMSPPHLHQQQWYHRQFSPLVRSDVPTSSRPGSYTPHTNMYRYNNQGGRHWQNEDQSEDRTRDSRLERSKELQNNSLHRNIFYNSNVRNAPIPRVFDIPNQERKPRGERNIVDARGFQ